MSVITKRWLSATVSALALLLPMGAFAQTPQTGDAAYCAALIAKYQEYVVISADRGANEGPADGNIAVSQCRSGNTAAGIPVLEKLLRNAEFDLPKRG
jgi:hypothetical protein